MNANARRIADDIIKLVEDQDNVSLAEVSRLVPGFQADQAKDAVYTNITLPPPFDNIGLWYGMTTDGAEGFDFAVKKSGRIYMKPTTALMYLIDGAAPNVEPLNEALGEPPKGAKRWVPIVLKRGRAPKLKATKQQARLMERMNKEIAAAKRAA